jgi:hypothetical protein
MHPVFLSHAGEVIVASNEPQPSIEHLLNCQHRP